MLMKDLHQYPYRIEIKPKLTPADMEKRLNKNHYYINRMYLFQDKAWTAINRLSLISKSDLIDKMKRSLFQAAVVSILLYGCTYLDANETDGEKA